jgi:hypothetical protein
VYLLSVHPSIHLSTSLQLTSTIGTNSPNITSTVMRSLKIYMCHFFLLILFFASSSLLHHFIFPSSFALLHERLDSHTNIGIRRLRTNERTEERTNERTEERTNERKNERTNERTPSLPLSTFVVFSLKFFFDVRSATTMTATITKTMMTMTTCPLLYITHQGCLKIFECEKQREPLAIFFFLHSSCP